MIYRRLLRPLLFSCDPEWIHAASIRLSRIMGGIPGLAAACDAWYRVTDPMLQVQVAGLQFDNPVGLAAGYDKSGEAVRLLESLGFGHVEIGSVSADPSAGNPKPRLFRLVQDQAILVHYGLQNDGSEAIANRLARSRHRRPLGINIVKTNRGIEAAPESADAIRDDYLCSLARLAPHADYLVLNLSCPNTEMGRDHFADRSELRRLLEGVAALDITCPVVLKVSPLGGVAAIESLLQAVDGFECIKAFAFNLSAQRPAGLQEDADRLAQLPGAVAGPPIRAQMNTCIAEMYRRMDRRRYQIIGIGGVASAADAYEKIRLGASLVQLLTGLVYHGPAVVKGINTGLLELLRRDGHSSIADAVGTAHADLPKTSLPHTAEMELTSS